MKLRQLKEIAKVKGFIIKNMKKENIIKMIQRAEMHSECFGTDNALRCSQIECLWREDCMNHMKKLTMN